MTGLCLGQNQTVTAAIKILQGKKKKNLIKNIIPGLSGALTFQMGSVTSAKEPPLGGQLTVAMLKRGLG